MTVFKYFKKFVKIEPGKRPRITLTPTLVTDNKSGKAVVSG